VVLRRDLDQRPTAGPPPKRLRGTARPEDCDGNPGDLQVLDRAFDAVLIRDPVGMIILLRAPASQVREPPPRAGRDPSEYPPKVGRGSAPLPRGAHSAPLHPTPRFARALRALRSNGPPSRAGFRITPWTRSITLVASALTHPIFMPPRVDLGPWGNPRVLEGPESLPPVRQRIGDEVLDALDRNRGLDRTQMTDQRANDPARIIREAIAGPRTIRAAPRHSRPPCHRPPKVGPRRATDSVGISRRKFNSGSPCE